MSQVSHSHLVFVHGVSIKGSESKRNNTVQSHTLVSTFGDFLICGLHITHISRACSQISFVTK